MAMKFPTRADIRELRSNPREFTQVLYDDGLPIEENLT